VIKYYSFVDDLVFDPFAGSGTLGMAAANLNRNFFLTEKEPKYIRRMKEDLIKKNDPSNLKNHQANFVDIISIYKLTKGKI
jgi:DNA modification methylase